MPLATIWRLCPHPTDTIRATRRAALDGDDAQLRDALVTLDGRMAGASYREIAIVLYGLDYVERNWMTGLKERMRRHFLRGLLFSTGRYRDLLRKVCRFRGGLV